MASAVAATSAGAIIVRDDVGTDGAVDADNTLPAVGQLIYPIPNSGGFVSLCTGTLINPRTVLTAAHCFATNLDGSETPFENGNPEVFGGAGIPLMVSFDVNTLASAQSWFGSGFQTGNGAYSATDVLVHPGNSAFPNFDIAMVALDTPIDHIDPMALLLDVPNGVFVEDPDFGSADFFPDEFLHAVIAGYGNAGTGSEGITVGIDFSRRVGENTVPVAFFFTDRQGAATPPMWTLDFDDPFGDVFPVDVIGDGGALPGEVGTAPGDSGGALIFDELAPFPVIGGVLSGGGSLGPVQNGYGDFSIYPMLALASDWIVANNPYKYVSAGRGNGDWMNPYHWVQELDPGYYVFGADGTLVNGLADDLPTYPVEPATEAAPESGGGAADAGLNDLSGAPIAIYDPALMAASGLFLGWGGPAGNPWVDPLSGPGSTGFVPNNTDGAPSGDPAIEGAPAQYFDVSLYRSGTTWLRDSVEVDRLTKTFGGFGPWGPEVPDLWIKSSGDLTVNLDALNYAGELKVDGALTARRVVNGGEDVRFAAGGHGLFRPGGVISGSGVISVAEGLHNVSGFVNAGKIGRVGELTVDGDFIQGADAALMIDVSRRGWRLSADLLTVTGVADLDGAALVAPDHGTRLRYGDRFTVIDAASVVGDFDDIDLLYTSAVLFGKSDIDAAAGDVDIVIDAKPYKHFYGSHHHLGSLAAALDNARWGGGFSALGGVFGLVDSQGLETLDFAMTSLTPQAAFDQTMSSVYIANSFRSHLSLRGAELRSGARGLSGARYFGGETAGATAPSFGAAPALTSTGAMPKFDDAGRFGMFIAGDGALNEEDRSYRAGFGEDPYVDDLSATGDLAVGFDYRVTEGLAVGVAALANRYDIKAAALTPLHNESYGAAAYATAFGDRWFVDTYAGFARQDYELERNVYGADDAFAVALGAPRGEQSMAGMRAGVSFQAVPGVTISPVTSLDYASISLSDYSESAGGEFDLLVEGRDLTSVSIQNAVEVSWLHQRDRGGVFGAFGRFGVVNELGDGVDVVRAAFADAPEYGFDVARDLDREWYSASAGVSVALSPTLSTRFEFNSDIDRGDLSSQSASVAFNWRF